MVVGELWLECMQLLCAVWEGGNRMAAAARGNQSVMIFCELAAYITHCHGNHRRFPHPVKDPLGGGEGPCHVSPTTVGGYLQKGGGSLILHVSIDMYSGTSL